MDRVTIEKRITVHASEARQGVIDRPTLVCHLPAACEDPRPFLQGGFNVTSFASFARRILRLNEQRGAAHSDSERRAASVKIITGRTFQILVSRWSRTPPFTLDRRISPTAGEQSVPRPLGADAIRSPITLVVGELSLDERAEDRVSQLWD